MSWDEFVVEGFAILSVRAPRMTSIFKRIRENPAL